MKTVISSEGMGHSMAHNGRLLKTSEVAQQLGVDTATVGRYIREGILPATATAGGHHRIYEADLYAFMANGGRTRVTFSDNMRIFGTTWNALCELLTGRMKSANVGTCFARQGMRGFVQQEVVTWPEYINHQL